MSLLAATAASAQDSPLDERARLHFESGASYYDAGNYERALEEFQTAFELSQRKGLLYNLYLAHERLGNLDEAIDHLARYLSEADVPEERRVILEQRLEHLRARAASAPEPDPVQTSPPSPRTEEPILVDSGGGSGLSTPALFSFIAAGAGLVLGGVFGTMAVVEHGRLEDDCSPACLDGDVSSLDTFNLIADIGFGVAVAGGILGAVFLATSGGDETTAPSAWLTPGGAGVRLRGTL